MLQAPSLLGNPSDATRETPFLRHAAMCVFGRLNAFASLPILMPWHVMTTISVSGPAGSGIAMARGLASAAMVAGAAAGPASTGRFSRLFDGLAAVPPGWGRPEREAAGLMNEGVVLPWLRC